MLGGQEVEALLQGDAFTGELVIRGEASRVSRQGGVAIGIHFLQRVHALALVVDVVHQVHLGGL